MKLSAMLRLLQEAQWNNSPVREAELEYYLAQGSFRVREAIYQLIQRRSIVVGELRVASRFRLIGEQMRAAYGRVEMYAFLDYMQCFLGELINFKIVGVARQERLQELLDFVDGILGELPLAEARYQEAVLIDPIVSRFPEVVNRKVYQYSTRLTAMIASSHAIYGRA